MCKIYMHVWHPTNFAMLFNPSVVSVRRLWIIWRALSVSTPLQLTATFARLQKLLVLTMMTTTFCVRHFAMLLICSHFDAGSLMLGFGVGPQHQFRHS